MMVRSSIQHAGMNVGFGAARESLEKIIDQLGLKIAHKPGCCFGVNDGSSTAAKIDCGHAHGFIHRHQEISGAKNAALRTQSLVECLPDCDTYVLYGVVLIDVEITVGFELQIESAMMGK